MIRFVSLRLFLAAGLPLLLAGQTALAQPQEPETQPRKRSVVQRPAEKTPASQEGRSSGATQKDPKKDADKKATEKKGADKKGADAKGAEKKGVEKKTAKSAAVPGGAQAALLANFGDWGAYASQQGRSKICYALARPKEQQPKDKRSPAYLFVSFRPAENVRNEVAVVMGLPTKDGGEAEAVVGKTTYALVTKDQNAWIKNPAEESKVVATMSKGQTLVVKAASKAGAKVTDSYSLNGFGPALERARKECS